MTSQFSHFSLSLSSLLCPHKSLYVSAGGGLFEVFMRVVDNSSPNWDILPSVVDLGFELLATNCTLVQQYTTKTSFRKISS